MTVRYLLKKIKNPPRQRKQKCEFRIICYDGSVRLLSGTLTCTSTFYGLSFLQYFCLYITELYNAQCELILQNEKIKQNETSIAAMRDSLQDIMTNLPAGIIVYDIVNGKPCLKYISDNVYEVFGCDGSETGTPEGVCFENIISHINGSGNADSGFGIHIIIRKIKSGGGVHTFHCKQYTNPRMMKRTIRVMDITENALFSEKAQEKRNALYRPFYPTQTSFFSSTIRKTTFFHIRSAIRTE